MKLSRLELAEKLEVGRDRTRLLEAKPVEPGYQPHECFSEFAQTFSYEIEPGSECTVQIGVDKDEQGFAAVVIVENSTGVGAKADAFFEASKAFPTRAAAALELVGLPTVKMLSTFSLTFRGYTVTQL